MSEKKTGKVYLVGAGPGDPGLITWRGLEALGIADIVYVDALVEPTLVATLPAGTERVFVGKYAGNHSVPQKEIEELLIKSAKEGKTVVRLKGGDPYVFGRGGEEALSLQKAGVPFEVVPGVTAAVAASAYAGIPITHRGLSTFAVMLTAHESPDKNSEMATVPFDTLGKLKGGTFAGYMGVRTLAKVAESFISNGTDPNTPAALIERGTTGAQRKVVAPLKDLDKKAKEESIKPPALFVIGDVVSLSEEIDWFDPGPLAGKRVMVMRPASQAGHMYELLRSYGVSVIPAPSITTKGVYFEKNWKTVLEKEKDGGWLIFTSENGVRFFLAGLMKSGKDMRWFGNFKIASIGAGTKKVLAQYGLNADFQPSKYTTEYLAAELPEKIVKGETVIRVRGNPGNSKVEEAMEKAGAVSLPIQVYETLKAPLEKIVRAWVAEKQPDVISFTSGSTFTSFLEQWGDEADSLLKGGIIASIGPMTSAIIREHGYEVVIEGDPHDVNGLVESIKNYYSK